MTSLAQKESWMIPGVQEKFYPLYERCAMRQDLSVNDLFSIRDLVKLAEDDCVESSFIFTFENKYL